MSDSPENASPDPQPPADAGRLTGWKEIAAHLGRGTRTVQRWEKDYELPVRRLASRGGRAESVFAFVRELDDWLTSGAALRARESADASDATGSEEEPASQASHVPDPSEADDSAEDSRRGGAFRLAPWLAAVLSAVVTLAVVLLAGYAWVQFGAGQAPLADRFPASAEAEVDTLRVTNAAGQELWRHRFPYPFHASSNTEQDDIPATIVFQDIDGDGAYEVLVRAVFDPPHRGTSAVYCFNQDGALRWTYHFEGRAEFGSVPYDGPYIPYRLFVTPSPDDAEQSALWVVSIHAQLFPAVLQRLDPKTGAASGQYWSDGSIDAVRLTWLGEERVLLVGACHNESNGASLAVLDAVRYSGSAPAAEARHRCTSCGPAAPLAFIVFPKPRRFASIDSPSDVLRIEIGSREIVVSVRHASAPVGRSTAVLVYRLSPALAPLGASLGSGYRETSAALARALLIPPDVSSVVDADRESFPLLQWDGSAFAPVSHAASPGASP